MITKIIKSILLGNDANFNLDSKNGNVTDADYQLVGRQGRGKAQEIELGDNYRLMKMRHLPLVCQMIMLGQ